MGHGGIGIGIHAVEGAVQAEDTAIHEAVLEFLERTWGELLSGEWASEAIGWISLGEDSLLTIEAGPQRVTFWFYDSVEWPKGLAAHWLEVALAGRRYWLDERLRALGYRLDFATVPPVRKRLYLAYEGRIGLASREEVQWVVGAPSRAAELSPELREQVARVLESERCACPLCAEVRASVPDNESARAGWSLALVDWQEAAGDGWTQVIRHGDELFLTLFSGPLSYAWLRGRLGGPWKRVDPHPPANWTHLSLDRRDRTWVARTSAGQTLQSLDAERWAPVSTVAGGPVDAPEQARVVGAREAHLWLVSEGPLRLWRSADGGRTYTEHPGPPTHTRCKAALGTGRLMAALCGEELWVSADEGESWRQAELPPELYGVQVLIDEAQEALVVFGSVAPEGVVAGFSYDGGQSWEGWARELGESHRVAAVASAGRWWWSVTAGIGAPKLFTAPELGGRWEPCAALAFDRLFPDPSEPHTVWASYEGTVVRVRPAR